jgi:protein-S-isoprenylcysteine O-methyltransferase Ste14
MSSSSRLITPRIVVSLVFVLFVIPMVPLLITGKWGWWEGWTYVIVSMVGFVLSRALAARHHPDLLAERAHYNEHGDTQPWDRVLAPVVALGSVVILVVAGLDVRFGWSPTFSLPVRLVGLGLLLAGYLVGSYAMIENRFFSGTVRIQNDRGHRVVSSGPYRWMRHPGYLGAVIAYLGTPALLSSVWAFLPSVVLVVLLVVRTQLEDATLRTELEGYQQYAERVRHRLVPGVW